MPEFVFPKPIAKDASATVKNGSIVGGTGYYTIDNYGTATLEDVTATAGNTDSSMIRNDGTLTSKQSVVQNRNKAQILGGNLTGIIWTDS